MKVTFITRHFFSFIVPITIEAPSFDEAVRVFDSANTKIQLKFVPMFTFEGECVEHLSIDRLPWQGSVPYRLLDLYIPEWLAREKRYIADKHAMNLYRLERIRSGEVLKLKTGPIGNRVVVTVTEQEILEALEETECEVYAECDVHVFLKGIRYVFDTKAVIAALVADSVECCRSLRKRVRAREAVCKNRKKQVLV